MAIFPGFLRKKISSNGKTMGFPPAIEIGSTAIKLVQLAKASSGYEIVKIVYWPLGAEGQQTPVTIRDSLKKLIENQKITGPVVTSLPLGKIHALNFLLPQMPEAEIEQALVWKLKSNLPEGLSFEGTSFDYVPWVSKEGHKEIRVLVFAASKQIVREHLKLFQDLGLEPTAVEPEPYASLEAVLGFGKFPEDQTLMVLQLGASHSSLAVVHQGYPFSIEPLAVCGNTLTQAIAHYHRLDFKKAEDLKRQAGSPQSTAWPAILSLLENLIVEIEHTFRSFLRQIKSPSVVLNRLVLCGGGAVLPNLAVFLGDRLAVAADVFNPLGSPHLRLKTELTPQLKENAASFSGALGLAARSIAWEN